MIPNFSRDLSQLSLPLFPTPIALLRSSPSFNLSVPPSRLLQAPLDPCLPIALLQLLPSSLPKTCRPAAFLFPDSTPSPLLLHVLYPVALQLSQDNTLISIASLTTLFQLYRAQNDLLASYQCHFSTRIILYTHKVEVPEFLVSLIYCCPSGQ